MNAVLAALSAFAGHARWFVSAHLTVGYLIACVLALPAVVLGQGMEPYIGTRLAQVLTVGLEWGSFLLVYGFIRRGGLNALMRRLCPWREWSGPWWECHWPRAVSDWAKRRVTPTVVDSAKPPGAQVSPTSEGSGRQMLPAPVTARPELAVAAS